MGNVRRVYAEKKADYAVAAKSLLSEIKSYLGIDTVTGVRVLIRYDVENISDETYQKALRTVSASRRWIICTRRPSPMRVRSFL